MTGVFVALAWANYSYPDYERFLYYPFLGPLSFHFFANDIFMVFFFGIAAVEITQSFLPGGDLHPLGKAVNPLLATAGGVIGPIVVYFVLNRYFGTPATDRGWGIPTATDIAFAWMVARMVFGGNHPAISFLLLLAVVDDGIGLAIIAIFYSNPLMPVEPQWLVLVAAGMLISYLLRRARVLSYWPYILVGGGISWAGLFTAHLHPALALVFIIPFLPHAAGEKEHLFQEDRTDRSAIAQFEHEWKLIVDFGLFLFGLANAGVAYSQIGTATWLVLAALLIGKSGGIFSMGMLAVKLGFPLPENVHKKELLVVGIIAGIGFTVALFVAGEAFTQPALQGAAKMGAMISCSAALLAVIVAKLFKIQKID